MTFKKTSKNKVVVVGYFGVGKTSLINRFINNIFSEKYKSTIGVKIGKKSIVVGETEVVLLIWDTEGKKELVDLPKSYFMGCQSIIYVFDLTRKDSYKRIKQNTEFLSILSPKSILKIVGNKSDLLLKPELDALKESIDVPIDYFTSAKTGDQVESMFMDLAKQLT